MQDAPAAVAYDHEGTDRIYTFITACNGHLDVNFWNGVDRWLWARQGAPALDARLADAASALTSWQFYGFEQRFLHVLANTQDGRLAEHFWSPTSAHPRGAGWHWLDHGRPAPGVAAIDGPDAIAFRRQSRGSLHDTYDRIDVFVHGSDGRLYRSGWDARRDSWQWQNHGQPAAGVTVRSRSGSISYVHDGTRRIYAFVEGSDGRLWVNYSDNTEVQAPWRWADLGRPPNVPIRGRPAAMTFVHEGRERIYVFVRGTSEHLYACHWNGVDRWEWADLGHPAGRIGVAGDAAVVPYVWDGTHRMYVFVRGSDGHLHTCYWNGVDRWIWADLGSPTPPGVTVTSSPGVVPFRYDGADRLYAFARGSDGHLHLCYWNGRDQWLWRDQGASPPGLTVTGIERTQAIQFFRPGLTPCPDRPGTPGRCPDNDVALVAEKATILRIYPDVCGAAEPAITGLTGTLEIRPAGTPTWEIVPPVNGPISPRPSADIDRGEPDHTLNFRIPAIRCRGQLETRVTVFDADRSSDGSRRSTPVLTTLAFGLVIPLKVRVIRIRYRNAARGMDLPAPTLSDFMNTVQFTLRTYPIPDVQVVGDSEELYDGDFTSLFDDGNPMGARGTTGPIFSIIDRVKDAELGTLGSRVKYYALFPAAPVNQSGATGWGVSPDRAAGEVNADWVMAQELGHTCGLAHAPCGVPDPDPNYPPYDPARPASIGEYGVDIVSGAVKDPATYRDFMSYCGPRWVSPYTYESLARSCFLPIHASPAPSGDGQTAMRRECVRLPITIRQDDEVVLRDAPFLVVPPRPGLLGEPVGERTRYRVVLYGRDDGILESQVLHLPYPRLERGDGATHFTAMLPWHADATALAIRKDDRVLYRMEVAPAAPRVSIERPAGGETLTGHHEVSWTISGVAERPSCLLRYSADGGESWRFVAGPLDTTSVTVDLDGLPAGERCLFQLLATAGFRTGTATSEPFRVPDRPPRLLIASPRDGDRIAPASSVYLFGAAFVPGGATANPDRLRWSSSRDGALGAGSQVIVQRLSPGEHRITLESDLSNVKPASVRLLVE
jgi:hypothetical protein